MLKIGNFIHHSRFLLAFALSVMSNAAYSNSIDIDNYDVYTDNSTPPNVYLKGKVDDSLTPPAVHVSWAKTDLLNSIYEFTSSVPSLLIRSDGSGGYITTVNPSNNQVSNYTTASTYSFQIGDFNGDGKSDLLLVSPASNVESLAILSVGSSPAAYRVAPTGGSTLSVVEGGSRDLIQQSVGQSNSYRYFDGTNFVLGNEDSAEGPITNVPTTVGVTDGSFSVSKSGAATYSVPVSVPVGVNGLSPRLALNYSSRGGNGLLGMGWSLSGLSVIHRCARTYEQDGYAKGISLTSSDALCLNGNRLIPVNNSTNFTDQAEYRTEIESFSKIVQSGSGNNIAFTIWTKDGRIVKHEKQIDTVGLASNTGYVWPVSSIEDRDTNVITYTYVETGNGQYYPTAIEYDSAKIVFKYNVGQRQDAVQAYIAGASMVKEKYLTSIETQTLRDGGLKGVKKYTLIYEDETNERYSPVTNRLTMIGWQECGFDLAGSIESCKGQTKFDLADASGSYNSVNSAEATSVTDRHETISLDWNGDGRQDLIVANDNGIYVHIADDNGDLGNASQVYSTSASDHVAYSITPIDYDSDGQMDIIFRDVTAYGNATASHSWKLMKSDSTASITVAAAHSVRNGALGSFKESSPVPVISDFNGNGQSDFIIPVGNQWTRYQNNYHLSSSFIQKSVLNFDMPNYPVISVTGRDASGVTQLLVRKKNGNFYRLTIDSNFTASDLTNTNILTKNAVMIDVNGDGLSDIVTAIKNEAGSDVVIYFNEGDGFSEQLSTGIDGVGIFIDYQGSLSDRNYPVKAVDVNNDGLQDLVYTNSLSFQVFYSNGHGFEASTNLDSGLSFYSNLNGGNEAYSEIEFDWIEDVETVERLKKIVLDMNAHKKSLLDQLLYGGIDFWHLGLHNMPSDLQKFYAKSIADNDLGSNVKSVWYHTAKTIELGEEMLNVLGSANKCSTADTLSDQIANLKTLEPVFELLSNKGRIYSLAAHDWIDKETDGILYNGAGSGEYQGQGSTFIFTVEAYAANAISAEVSCDKVDRTVEYALLYGKGAQDFHFVDVNGDGQLDVIQLKAPEAEGVIPKWTVAKQTRALPDKIESITDSNGSYQNITYKSQVNSASYTTSALSASFPEQKLNAPLYLVERVVRSNGLGGSRATSYSYQGALLNRQGRGFLGYRTRNVTDNLTGVVSHSRFKQEFPYIGALDYRSVTVGQTVVKSTDNTWSSDKVSLNSSGAANDHLYFPHISATTTEQRELNNVEIARITSTYGYDSYGNVINQVLAKARNNITEQQVTTATTFDMNGSNNDPSNWLISFADATEVTSSGINNGLNTADRDVSNRVINTTNTAAAGTLKPASSTRFNADHDLYLNSINIYGDQGLLAKQTIRGANVAERSNGMLRYANDRYPQRFTESEYGADPRQLTYDLRFGLPVTERGYDGLLSQRTYDAFGRVLTETAVDGTATSYSYERCTTNTCTSDVHGAGFASYKVTATNPVAPTSVSYLDNFDREVLRITDGFISGQATAVATTYTAEGYIDSTTLPYFVGSSDIKSIVYSNHDALGRVGTETRPDGGSTSFVYRTSVEKYSETQTTETVVGDTASRDIVTISAKNSLGQVVRMVEASGDANDEITTEYDYDAHGNLDWVRVGGDASGSATTMRYDLIGNKLELKDPDTGTTTYRYDALGNLKTETDAKAQVASFTYDLLNRAKTRTDLSGTANALTTTWHYDKDNACVLQDTLPGIKRFNGQLCRVEMSDGKFDEAYGYSRHGLPSHTVTKLLTDNVNADGSAVFNSYILKNTYDANSRLKNITYPTGEIAAYEYSDTGYINKINGASAEENYWTATAADAFGNVNEFTLGNGINVVQTYDPTSGRLTAINSTKSAASDVQNLSYNWHTNGNLYSRNNSGVTETFNYDALNRLKGATGVEPLAYTYYANGNIKTKTGIAGDMLYGQTANAGPHALTTANGITYGYDANGNMTSRDGSSIVYSAFNKPIVINSATGNSAFRYGADRGRYYQKTGDVTTYYVAGGLFEEITDTSGAGAITQQKNYIGDFLVLTQQEGIADELNYLLQDHLGSVDTITDVSGSVVDRLSFDPFGARRNADVANDTDVTTHGYTGHEQLDEVGLIHMNGRVYDAAIGRFLSADILVQAPYNSQSYNRYSYVMNNPLSLVDPSGYEWEWWTSVKSYAAGWVDAFVSNGNFQSTVFTDAVNQHAAENDGWTGSSDNWLGVLKGSGGLVADIAFSQSGGVHPGVAEQLASSNSEQAIGAQEFADDFMPAAVVISASTGGVISLKHMVKGSKPPTISPKLSNQELVQEIATRAEAKIGGIGAVPGTLKHSYADRLLTKYQGIYGNLGLRTETSWLMHTEVRYGTKGSARLDVLDINSNINYDYKFTINPPGLTKRQIDKIQNNGPMGVVVQAVNP